MMHPGSKSDLKAALAPAVESRYRIERELGTGGMATGAARFRRRERAALLRREQAMGERSVDYRTDIYALGAVTYEMLSGEPPFAGPTAQSIVAKLLTDEPRSRCRR